jgi:tRNA(Ile)-lysidine synthase
MKLLQNFTEILFEYSLIELGDHVLVALSGGPDSVVMFDLFCRVRQELQLEISAAHFNHGLRGTEADADEEFVKKLCQRANVECWSDRGDVQNFAKKKKLSLEHAARKMRYNFFERVANSTKANAIATGHNANDQAETVLDRIIRGSGITGLEGIPVKRGKFIRPLLWTKRSEIMDYIQERNLAYRIDSSNVDIQFRRNRIRHTLLPFLQRDFNPRIVPTLSRLTQVMSENESYLLHESQKAYKQCIKFRTSDKIVLDILCFLTYFKIIQKYILMLGLEELGVLREYVHFSLLEQAINNIKRRRSGKILRVGKNCRVFVAGPEFVLQLDQLEESQKIVQINLEKEEHQLWAGLILRSKRYKRKGNSASFQSSTLVEIVDWEKLVNPVRVRVFKQGDRFFPLNMGNSKKLSDFFIDEKIPIYKRSQIPILESRDDIVWICGYRLDDRFKVTPQTRTILRLELLQKDNV